MSRWLSPCLSQIRDFLEVDRRIRSWKNRLDLKSKDMCVWDWKIWYGSTTAWYRIWSMKNQRRKWANWRPLEEMSSKGDMWAIQDYWGIKIWSPAPTKSLKERLWRRLSKKGELLTCMLVMLWISFSKASTQSVLSTKDHFLAFKLSLRSLKENFRGSQNS